MKRRPFGSTGLEVSAIGIGCSRIGGVGNRTSRAEELAMLQEAADAGINFFDTADIYAQGQSERILGQALRRRRSEVVIATKGGYVLPSGRRLLARVKPLARPAVRVLRSGNSAPVGRAPAAMAQDFSPRHLRVAVEGSLRRLRTDYIDVYQLHSPDRAAVASGEYVAVLEALRGQGKILHFGVAADDPEDVVDYDAHPGISSLQVPFNLVYQDAMRVVFPKAKAHSVAVIARSCYAAGLLGDGVPESTLRAADPNWTEFVRIRAISETLGRPLLETALQFSLAAEPIAVTIIGMRTRAHLRENLRNAAARPLSADELASLTRAS
jgi:aryl-alcohol dehydrogenase-like predicted oxidoreductase